MIILYGITNCDTIKKATAWLNSAGIDFTFHDYRKEGITIQKLEQWNNELGLQQLLNTKSTTWRSLSEAEKSAAGTASGAMQLMQAQPTLIKRPILSKDGKAVAAGFSEVAYSSLFS